MLLPLFSGTIQAPSAATVWVWLVLQLRIKHQWLATRSTLPWPARTLSPLRARARVPIGPVPVAHSLGRARYGSEYARRVHGRVTPVNHTPVCV